MMKYGLPASIFIAAVGQVAWLGAGLLAAQGQNIAGAATDWTVPRTAWGDPDLQGKWSTARVPTPMERPKEFGTREFLTDEELAKRLADAEGQPVTVDEDERTAQANERAPGHERGIRYQEYNAFWNAGPRPPVTPWRRTSLVVDPPDGQIPPLTLEAVARIEAREAARWGRSEADSWADRNLSERCLLTAFVRFASSERQFIQAPGYVAIIVYALNANDPIIVPLDGRPRLENVRAWLGVPRGHWEGTTLVVETTQINSQQDGGAIMPSRLPLGMPSGSHLGSGEAVRLVERFTRVSPDMIEYSYTIDDPTTYVRPYTVLRPLTKQSDGLLMPENACHEHNYGIVGQLSAGRADPEYALEAAESEAAGRQGQIQEMKRQAEEWVKSHRR